MKRQVRKPQHQTRCQRAADQQNGGQERVADLPDGAFSYPRMIGVGMTSCQHGRARCRALGLRPGEIAENHADLINEFAYSSPERL
jgi:hypothetical protein